jgi:hypothetical protein
MNATSSSSARWNPPKRLHLQAWVWGVIELAALWRARWLQRGSRDGE